MFYARDIFFNKFCREYRVCINRTHNLYVDSDKMWYLIKHHQAILPLEVESEGLVSFYFESNYESLDCNPNWEDQIMVGLSEVVVHAQTSKQLTFNWNSYIEKVKVAFVLLILFMEALCFLEFQKWLLICVSRKNASMFPLSTLYYYINREDLNCVSWWEAWVQQGQWNCEEALPNIWQCPRTTWNS